MNKKHIENTVYLSLGSNIEERKTNLLKAIHLLEKEIEITKLSMICESQSWAYNDKDYLNMCIEVQTKFDPYKLLEFTKSIEIEVGRKEKTKLDENSDPVYKSRIIDIDILLYNNEILQTDDLVIPHPRLHLRKFVLMPLNEIAPEIIHPLINKTVNTLYNRCTDNLSVVPYIK